MLGGIPSELQLNDSAPERESDGMGPITRAYFGENACHVPFHGVFVDREFDSDSFVRMAGCRKGKHVDFTRGQLFFTRMMGNLLSNVWMDALQSTVDRANRV
jgi:hypothetical protein